MDLESPLPVVTTKEFPGMNVPYPGLSPAIDPHHNFVAVITVTLAVTLTSHTMESKGRRADGRRDGDGRRPLARLALWVRPRAPRLPPRPARLQDIDVRARDCVRVRVCRRRPQLPGQCRRHWHAGTGRQHTRHRHTRPRARGTLWQTEWGAACPRMALWA